MKPLNERLILARQRAGYTSARDFAVKNNIREGTYQSHERAAGDLLARNPKNSTLKKYAEKMAVNYLWLLTGQGKMDTPTDWLAAEIENIPFPNGGAVIQDDKYQTMTTVMRLIDALPEEDLEMIAIRVANNLKKLRKAD